jgi:hypothetical protein
MEPLWLILLVGAGYWAYRRGKSVGSQRGFRAGRRKTRRRR